MEDSQNVDSPETPHQFINQHPSPSPSSSHTDNDIHDRLSDGCFSRDLMINRDELSSSSSSGSHYTDNEMEEKRGIDWFGVGEFLLLVFSDFFFSG